jgi:hypothetical protein
MGIVIAFFVQISNGYPGDVGIEGHPDVVYVERFDDASLSTVTARYSNVLNAGGMLLDTDVPAGSPAGGRSLRITATGGANNGGHLYRNLPAENDRWHIRYYVKYFSGGPYHHTGMWFGGYNPATPWPNPQAGIQPAGDDRMSISFEPIGGSRMDHYVYWMHMRTNPGGSYWGNDFIQDPSLTFTSGQWMCVEMMVKLNNPVTSYNGELACWVNGVQVSNLGLGFPNGSWVWDSWTPSASGTPFEGFQWRNSAALLLNYLWIEHYADTVPAGSTLAVKYDHIVVARSYIGPMLPDGSAPIPPSGGGGGGGGGGGCGSTGLDVMLPVVLFVWLVRRLAR